MTASPAFERVLKATGYLSPSGQPVPSLATAGAVDSPPQLRAVLDDQRGRLRADAAFSVNEHPISIFKDSGHREPPEDRVREWHETAWNLGQAPLLWVVAPTAVYLYDCYASPPAGSSQSVPMHALAEFDSGSEDQVQALTTACGRTATESGAFWSGSVGKRIDRRNRVDQQLLREVMALERRLIELTPPSTSPDSRELARTMVQCLIGRCIFTWYLIDRDLANSGSLPPGLGPSLSGMFATPEQALKLFAWLRSTFNGDLFSASNPDLERELLTPEHLRYIRMFVEGTSLVSGQDGQGRQFRFQFDAIPINLISAIYEQFAQSGDPGESSDQSLHYTPIEVVHLVLEPVFEGLPHDARIFDPACGSGVFLVEALRRLVRRAADGSRPTRDLVRQILYRQLYGFDKNESALQVAAFSLYLAAIELDEDPISDIRDLKFEPLIGRTLFRADSLGSGLPREIAGRMPKRHFDAVVGNPPWKLEPADSGRMSSPDAGLYTELPHRDPDLEFLRLANDITAGEGRVGMVVRATPFFSRSSMTLKARNELIDSHKPCALINLSHLRNEGLFPDSTAPAIVFFSRCESMPKNDACLVGSIPWSPDFARTGIFQLDSSAVHTVSVTHACSKPWALKSLALGTIRDNWLLDRWERTFPTLEEVLDELGVLQGVRRGVRRGQRFGRGTRRESPHKYSYYFELTPETYTPFRLDAGGLKRFSELNLHFSTNRSIFGGPLVVCPRFIDLPSGGNTGRYSVSIYDHTVRSDSNFFGIPCAGGSQYMDRGLSAILNSIISTYQLIFKASRLGVDRSEVRYQDLFSMRVPPLHSIIANSSSQFSDLTVAEEHAARNPNDADCLRALDEEAYKLYDLRGEERTVIEEGMDQYRQHLGSRALRSQAVQPPSYDTVCAYGRQVAETINAYLRTLGRRHLEATVYPHTLAEGRISSRVQGLAVVRLAMVAGPPSSTGIVRDGADSDLERLPQILRDEIGATSSPYLHERGNLRLYDQEEAFIVKPIETRYWTRTAALNDADTILGDHWRNDAVHAQ